MAVVVCPLQAKLYHQKLSLRTGLMHIPINCLKIIAPHYLVIFKQTKYIWLWIVKIYTLNSLKCYSMFRKTYHLNFHFSFPNATFHDSVVVPASVSIFLTLMPFWCPRNFGRYWYYSALKEGEKKEMLPCRLCRKHGLWTRVCYFGGYYVHFLVTLFIFMWG